MFVHPRTGGKLRNTYARLFMDYLFSKNKKKASFLILIQGKAKSILLQHLKTQASSYISHNLATVIFQEYCVCSSQDWRTTTKCINACTNARLLMDDLFNHKKKRNNIHRSQANHNTSLLEKHFIETKFIDSSNMPLLSNTYENTSRMRNTHNAQIHSCIGNDVNEHTNINVK